MQENGKNDPRQDDEAKQRLQGELRSNLSEDRELEPSGEDQPDPNLNRPAASTTAAPGDMDARDVQLRSELAQHLGGRLYPADRQKVLDTLRENQAPDRLVDLASQLPTHTSYANVQEIARALGLHTEPGR